MKITIKTILLFCILSSFSEDSIFTQRVNEYLSYDLNTLIHIHAVPAFESLSSGKVLTEDYFPIMSACLLAPLDGEYGETCSFYYYRLLANNDCNQRQIVKAISLLSQERQTKALTTLSDLLFYSYELECDSDSYQYFCKTFEYLCRQGVLYTPNPCCTCR